MEEEDDEDTNELTYKERNKPAKNKPSNNFFAEEGDNQKEGVLVDREGKKKNNKNLVFDDDQEIEDVKVYEKTGNKFKRNIAGGQNQGSEKNIDANTYDINTKKHKVQSSNRDANVEKGIDEGKFYDHQKSARDKPKGFFENDGDQLKEARTTEMRTKKVEKEDKKGLFASFANQDLDEPEIKAEKPKKRAEDYDEFEE